MQHSTPPWSSGNAVYAVYGAVSANIRLRMKVLFSRKSCHDNQTTAKGKPCVTNVIAKLRPLQAFFFRYRTKYCIMHLTKKNRRHSPKWLFPIPFATIVFSRKVLRVNHTATGQPAIHLVQTKNPSCCLKLKGPSTGWVKISFMVFWGASLVYGSLMSVYVGVKWFGV